jgi:hypothetical protein
MAVPKSILSFSGTLNIPHFTEISITNFLINYENMCEDYNIKKKKRIRRCSRYYVKHIIIIIRKLISFIEPDWEKPKKEMAKQFREVDFI